MLLRKLLKFLFGSKQPSKKEVFLETEKIKAVMRDPTISDEQKYLYCKTVMPNLLAVIEVAFIFSGGSYSSSDYIELRKAVNKLKVILEK